MLQDVKIECSVEITIVLKNLHINIPDEIWGNENDRNNNKEMFCYFTTTLHSTIHTTFTQLYYLLNIKSILLSIFPLSYSEIRIILFQWINIIIIKIISMIGRFTRLMTVPRYQMSMLNDYLTSKQTKKQEAEFKKEMEYLANKPSFTLMDYKQRI